jgi:serine/threonine-protein kinase HipA
MRAQLVFFLLGAIDGHAKNFSITLLPTGFRLAPIYDVMSVLPALARRQVEPKQTKLAMSVGDNRHYRLGEIYLRHWEQTAKKAGFPLKNLQSLIQDLMDRGNKIETLVNRIGRSLSPQLTDPLVTGIKKHLGILAGV